MMDFFDQGGYAFFVWSAFGMTFALLVVEALLLWRDQRTIPARIGRYVRMHSQGD